MRSTGLRTRMLLASGVLALAVALVISLLLSTVQDLRDSQKLALTSDRVLGQAAANEKLLIDMETGVRGFAITGRDEFLAPWRQALKDLPAAARQLESLTQGDPDQMRRARSIDSAIRSYATIYAAPLIQAVRTNSQAARSFPATAEGKRRVDSVREQIAVLQAVEGRRAGARRDHAEAVANRATLEAIAGLIGLVALVAFMTRYLGRALAREGRAATEASLAQARLAVLARASEILAESLDYERTLEQVAQVVVPVIADWCGVELAAEDGSLRNVAVAHVDPAKVEMARALQQRYPPDPDSATGAQNVMRTGKTELYAEIPDAMLVAGARDEEHLELIRALGFESAIVVPLIAHDRTLGVITLVSAESGRRYGPDDVPYVEDLARRAAAAIDNARLYEQERGVAETLQRSLLPESLPVLPRTQLAARYLPAERSVEVGGDWYDVIELPNACVLLAIGDVVGHGVNAAAVMGQLKSALRAYALEGHGPGATLDRLKAMLRTTAGGGMIGTLFLAIYDPQTGSLRYASAGHPPALIRAPDGAVSYLAGGRTTPLAVGAGSAREAEAPLDPGSVLVLYTDGLIERRGEGLGTGLERLERAVAEGPGDVEDLLDHLLSDLRGDGPSSDDTALLAMGPVRERAARMRIELPADEGSVTSARHAVARWLIGTGANDEEMYELTVAIGDACANAVEHAYGPGDATFAVGAELIDGEVVIEVTDGGRWRSPRGMNRGRGLQLMNAFTDSLEIDRTDEGTHVRMRRRLAGGGLR
jgi:CHASE3 domain sensor protein/anti-sigma regulatory factor (Ser/Thr protein kinase)